KWLTQFGSLDEILAGAESIKGVVGQNLRDHVDDVRRNRKLNRLLDDIEVPVEIENLELGAADETAVRDLFTQLEFRTLLKRVLDQLGGSSDEPAENAVVAPAAQTIAAAELTTWLASAEGSVGVTVSVHEGRPSDIGFATAGSIVEAAWNDDVAQAVGKWFASDAPKAFCDAKPQVKALARAGVRVAGLQNDALIAGWVARPSFPDKSLADLVDRYLSEKLPEGDPNQLLATGPSAGELAWYTLRVSDVVSAALPAEERSVLVDI